MSKQGISLEAAMESALESLGQGEPTSEPTSPLESQAQESASIVAEQSEQPIEDGELSLADITFDEDEQPEEESSTETDVNWDQEFAIPGLGVKTLRELVDGNLRQDDYTKKTQAIAEQRRQLESSNVPEGAAKLYELLQNDPAGTVMQMAQELGMADGLRPEADPIIPNNSDPQIDTDRINEMIEQRVQEALASRPEIEAVRQEQYYNQINGELDSIGRKYDVELSEQDKIAVLNNTLKTKHQNLELTFLQMREQLNKKMASKERVQQSSSGLTRTKTVETQADERPKTVKEAFQLAMAQLS